MAYQSLIDSNDCFDDKGDCDGSNGIMLGHSVLDIGPQTAANGFGLLLETCV